MNTILALGVDNIVSALLSCPKFHHTMAFAMATVIKLALYGLCSFSRSSVLRCLCFENEKALMVVSDLYHLS